MSFHQTPRTEAHKNSNIDSSSSAVDLSALIIHPQSTGLLALNYPLGGIVESDSDSFISSQISCRDGETLERFFNRIEDGGE
jgi:hypothetical protein